ncbi:ABC-2 type transport system ATP-binding protein [Lentibacillus persicus]|uniref:ABC-2 type transport system ATP-binding protein n=1 Tax=Lentibacillus persicus TaxID=640948 RepID=A0A1I1UDC5_9BACI|nr:ABC transporter ATP-binding protein [Lentibacillus persicus]SFD68846.1 ABC-2 type transport system ATP-binding protein [Lentibacillus persicus]
MDYVIQTNQLVKQFGREQAVDTINLAIPEGEVYGFLGPNGAGKTTTIRMLLGLMKPTSGTIHIFNRDLKKERISILKQVGSLVENPSYYPHLTARENLEALRKIYQVPKSRIDEVLAIVKLEDAADKKVKAFSLGMKQRLGIAAALLHEPKLLILDEPTNGLDPSGIIEVRHLIKSLPAKFGITVLISSHLLSEIDQMATSVGIISEGKLIFQDTIERLRDHAREHITLRVGDSMAASEALLVRGVHAESRDGLVFLQEGSDTHVAQAVRMLVQDGYNVYRIEEAKRSLEDIFLDMTKGNVL